MRLTKRQKAHARQIAARELTNQRQKANTHYSTAAYVMFHTGANHLYELAGSCLADAQAGHDRAWLELANTYAHAGQLLTARSERTEFIRGIEATGTGVR